MPNQNRFLSELFAMEYPRKRQNYSELAISEIRPGHRILLGPSRPEFSLAATCRLARRFDDHVMHCQSSIN
jgi:hypothetical protein